MKNNAYVYRVCVKCGEEKPLGHFWGYVRDRRDYVNYCVDCSRDSRRKKSFILDNFYRTGKEVEVEEVVFPYPIKGKDIEILRKVLEIFQKFFGRTLSELKEKTRKHEITLVRFIFFWVINELKILTEFDPDPFKPADCYIANFLGLHHAMFRHGVNVTENMSQTDMEYHTNLKTLYETIQNSLFPNREDNDQPKR